MLVHYNLAYTTKDITINKQNPTEHECTSLKLNQKIQDLLKMLN